MLRFVTPPFFFQGAHLSLSLRSFSIKWLGMPHKPNSAFSPSSL